jgi:hypothetical protein
VSLFFEVCFLLAAMLAGRACACYNRRAAAVLMTGAGAVA